MAFNSNNLVVKINNGFVQLVTYADGFTNDKNIANPSIGSVWAQKENKSDPQIIQFFLADKTIIAGANFAAIKDLNGNPFGLDIDSALSAILALIAPNSGSGGGGGDATAANQVLQTTELQSINAKTPKLAVTQKSIQSVASTNTQNVKVGTTILSQIIAQNTTTTTRYVNVYDKSSAPNPAIDTAQSVLIRKIAIHPNQTVIIYFNDMELKFGLGVAIVNGAATNDNTGVTLNSIFLTVKYI